MPSTTVHFPEDILKQIDRAAGNLNISRNRFVIEACKEAVAKDLGLWPDDFFSVTSSESKALDDAVLEMERIVRRNRKNRGAPLL